MYQDFLMALNKKYHCSDKSELTGLDLQHYTFASTTNSRGSDAIAVFEAYGFTMSGLKILDVGCAYGGFSIEAARKGAHCYGVEIAPYLYELAVLNNNNEQYDSGSCEFVLVDATSPDFLEQVPQNYFDLIIVNDVFEHVYDTVQLLRNLDKVANSKCAIYFVIPNGNDLRFAAKEGHTGYCGLSLIHPLLWHTRMFGNETDDRSIYYRQFDYYQALFQHFGFGIVDLINYPGYLEHPEINEKILTEYAIMRQTIAEHETKFTDVYAQRLQSAVKVFDQQLQYDLQHMDGPELGWKYMTKFWAGFAQKRQLSLNPLCKTSDRGARSDQDNYGIAFELCRRGSQMEISVTCGPTDQDLDFAFDLMRRGENIERSRYQQEPHYEWELKSPGMYWVAIYVKKREHESKDYRILTNPLYFPGKA